MTKPTPYTTKVAIPLPAEEDVRRAMGEAYKPDVLNLTKTLTGTGDCFPAVVALVKARYVIAALAQSGALDVHVDQCFPIAGASDAHELARKGGAGRLALIN